MRVQILKEGRFRVAAVMNGERVPVLDFLRECPADMRGSAAGMWALFSRYAEAGRQRVPTAVFHEANRKEGIWQFIKGRLRLFCFIDEGAVVIITHGAVKKSQKADSSEVGQAVRVKAEYLNAKRCGEVQWLPMAREGVGQ